MRYLLFTVFVFVTGINISIAQKRYTVTLQGSVILKDVDDKYNAAVYNLEMPETDADIDQARLQAIKENISKTYPRKMHSGAYKKSAAAMPTVDIQYVTDSFSGVPPDNDVAINRNNRSASVINSYITVQDATNGKFLYRKGLMPFSAAVGLNSFSLDFRYDPKIMYDPEADRFICTMLNSTDGRNYIVVGFSGSNKPDSVWHFYKFYGDYNSDSTWFDFPSVAMTQNEFFFTGNKIKYSTSWQAGFRRSVIYQVRKQDGYNGDTALHYQIWDSVTYNGEYIRNLYPVKGGNSIKGPEQYFLSDRNFDVINDTVFLVKLPDTIGGSAGLTVKALVSPVYYGVPPDGRQPDTSVTLATNDGRILGAFAEGNLIQFVSATIDTSTGSSAIYHGRISNYSGVSPAIQANIIRGDTLDYGYPNVTSITTPGSSDQSIISFNYTGPHTFPGFGAVFFDGTQYSPLLKIKEGYNSIKILSQKQQRWGDYSGAQVDWTDMAAVWVEGIFGRNTHGYGNYIARLKSPNYTSVPEQKTTLADNSKLYPNPAWQIIEFDFELKEEGIVNFVVYDIQGKIVDKILSANCKEGKNIVRFNIAPLQPGTYYLKVTGDAGTPISTHSFVKQ